MCIFTALSWDWLVNADGSETKKIMLLFFLKSSSALIHKATGYMLADSCSDFSVQIDRRGHKWFMCAFQTLIYAVWSSHLHQAACCLLPLSELLRHGSAFFPSVPLFRKGSFYPLLSREVIFANSVGMLLFLKTVNLFATHCHLNRRDDTSTQM